MKLVLLQLLPKNIFSRLMGFLANRSLSRLAIGWYANRFKVNVEEAELSLSQYKTLNQFFARRLKSGVRPIESLSDSKAIISPVDGTLVQWGSIQKGRMIQAKGLDYHIDDLLGSHNEAQWFWGGTYLTIYLAPVDYHRIHYPIDGSVVGYRALPGTLYPVNQFSMTSIRYLFPGNERIVTYMEGAGHRMALVKVGATVVGKIKVTYDSIESNRRRMGKSHFYEKPKPVKKGDELGHFEMGSTVILLLPQNSHMSMSFNFGTKLRMGQDLGSWL